MVRKNQIWSFCRNPKLILGIKILKQGKFCKTWKYKGTSETYKEYLLSTSTISAIIMFGKVDVSQLFEQGSYYKRWSQIVLSDVSLKYTSVFQKMVSGLSYNWPSERNSLFSKKKVWQRFMRWNKDSHRKMMKMRIAFVSSFVLRKTLNHWNHQYTSTVE